MASSMTAMISKTARQTSCKQLLSVTKKFCSIRNGACSAVPVSQVTRAPFSAFARGVTQMEMITMKVPTMGDSITEGTIVEWGVEVGQTVKEGDVVALVETDKVTLDIKAESDGVLTAQFGAVDDTVEVGADLYQLDTDGVASVSPAVATVDSGNPLSSDVHIPSESATISTDPTDDRVPSIYFLGKEGWKLRLSGSEAPTPAVQTNDLALPEPVSLEMSYLDPMYGRPAFSEEEMEALITGGACCAPDVKLYSGGAVFQQ